MEMIFKPTKGMNTETESVMDTRGINVNEIIFNRESRQITIVTGPFPKPKKAKVKKK